MIPFQYQSMIGTGPKRAQKGLVFSQRSGTGLVNCDCVPLRARNLTEERIPIILQLVRVKYFAKIQKCCCKLASREHIKVNFALFRGQAEHRNEIHNTARCLAELTHSWAIGKGNVPDYIQPVIEQMLQDAQHSDSEKVKQFSLLTLGEMGRRLPLGPTVIQQQISQFKVKLNSIIDCQEVAFCRHKSSDLVFSFYPNCQRLIRKTCQSQEPQKLSDERKF